MVLELISTFLYFMHIYFKGLFYHLNFHEMFITNPTIILECLKITYSLFILYIYIWSQKAKCRFKFPLLKRVILNNVNSHTSIFIFAIKCRLCKLELFSERKEKSRNKVSPSHIRLS